VIALKWVKDATRKLHTFAVPHFPYDDSISPQDRKANAPQRAALKP
jgi:hypothetical protein